MKYVFVILLFVFVSCNGSDEHTQPHKAENTPLYTNGEILFKNYCANCHKADKDYTGPSLANAADHWPDKKLMYDFVRNAPEVMKKNSYAKKLFNKYSPTVMYPFPNLTDKEIDSILDYCIKYKPETGVD